MFEYSQEQFNKQFNRAWKRIVINKNITPSENPIAYLIGGQAGAGKSSRVKNLLKENPNFISIDADICKTFHPHYEKIQSKHPQEAHNLLSKFAGTLKDKITDKALKERYNVIIEGTFREARIPIKILTQLKEHNYSTNIVIQTCHKDISWASCLEREKIIGRAVNKEYHDNLCNIMAKNVEEVYKSGLADRLQVFVRFPQDENLSTFKQIEVYNSNRDGKFTENTINKYLLQKAKERNKSHIKQKTKTNSKGFER